MVPYFHRLEICIGASVVVIVSFCYNIEQIKYSISWGV